MKNRALAALALALASVAVPRALARPDDEPLERGHEAVAAPFLKKHCARCHDGGKENESDVSLLPLLEKAAATSLVSIWRKARERVRASEMPPPDEPQPTREERDAFLAWTARALQAGAQDPGRVTVRRLNRAEYGYTVQDLLHVRPRPSDEFPADDTGYGFDRIGDVLTVPPLLLEKYLQASEQIAAEAILDWKPVKLHLDASELKPPHAKAGGMRGSFFVLYTNGRLEGQVKVPWTGEYVVRARAYGDQAGADPAHMVLLVDGQEVAAFDVPATEDAPKVYEARVKLEAGERALGAAFTNDFFNPDDPDPKKRDRNLAVAFVEAEGPAGQPELPWAHRTYVTKRPAAKAKPEARRNVAREVLAPLASRAFRRPVKPEELDRLAKLVDMAMTDGETFERGLQLALEAILCSPSFLFRCEDAKPLENGIEALDDYALASRLSYFVWSSLADDELTQEAARGTLREHLEAQTRRLLADPRGARLVEQFAIQWLHLRRLDSFTPDPGTFPGYDEALKSAARAETVAFVHACLQENLPVISLVDAPFSFVNERLARHYGIEGVSGAELVRTEMPPERRGLLGHASVLLATSNPTRTSPVKRGRWILEVLLDDPPPPPLPGTDSLKDDGTPFAARTLRERLEHHREKKECAVCHARMDPLGFALERFDAIGALRPSDETIDDVGQLPNGRKLDGALGLRAYLRERPRKLARAVAKKLLVFALGRGTIAADELALDAAVDAVSPELKLADLVVALTKLDAFQKRRKDGGKPWK